MTTHGERIAELRKLAAEIRQRATESGLAGYAEKMERAAADLEKAADALTREES